MTEAIASTRPRHGGNKKQPLAITLTAYHSQLIDQLKTSH
jgi:hypothetical protein